MLQIPVSPPVTALTSRLLTLSGASVLDLPAPLQIEEALRIFQDMVQRGCERNVITYSSLISACEKAGRWQLALELLEEMHRDGCKPNVVTFNSLIGACGQGAQLPAQALFCIEVRLSCLDKLRVVALELLKESSMLTPASTVMSPPAGACG